MKNTRTSNTKKISLTVSGVGHTVINIYLPVFTWSAGPDQESYGAYYFT